MLEKYRTNIDSLTPAEASMLCAAVERTHPTAAVSPGGSMFAAFAHAGLTQADLVLAMAPDPSPEAVLVLEKLVGKPIDRGQLAASQHLRVRDTPIQPRSPDSRESGPLRGNAVRRSDNRKISWVSEKNPKKPGSAAHAKFSLYRVGMSIDEFIAAGGTMADVKWDTERGFIRMEEA
jgi:hypothetical protein